MSALPPKADMGELSRNVRLVPKADSCTAAKAPLFDHLVGEDIELRRDRYAQREVNYQVIQKI